MEVWKDIKGYEGRYIISNAGNVLSYKGKLIKLRAAINGYLRVWLNNEHGYKAFSVHRIVSAHFIPNHYNKPFVNHINGSKTDNRVANLEWCTQSENMRHAFLSGLQKPNDGERNGQSKLTYNQVEVIRKTHLNF